MLKPLPAKAESLASEAQEYMSYDVVSVQEDNKVVDHVQDLLSWNIDFVVVKDKGKVVRGVIGRDQLNDIVNEKVLDSRNGKSTEDLTKMSFRDLIENKDLKEYYIIDEDKERSEANLWVDGLPPREVVIMKNHAVKAVIGRRWFRRWQRLVRFF